MKKEIKLKKEEAEAAAAEVSQKEKASVSEKDEVRNKNASRAGDDEVLVNEGKVGSMLHDARLKLGKKINEAAKDLCIRRSYLEAMEAGNYDEIPEAPYGIGFIRSYANYLGLNSARMVQLYKEETAANSQAAGDYYVMEPQAEVTAPNKKYILISLLAIFLVYFSWIIYNENRNSGETAVDEDVYTASDGGMVTEFPLQVEDFVSVEETLPEAEETAVSVETKPEEPAPVETVEPVEEQKTEAPEVIKVNEGSYVETQAVENAAAEPGALPAAAEKPQSRVQVRIKGGDTWIEVKDAEKLYISKVLHDGDIYNVPEGQGMILSVGRYEGVDVFIDGKLTEVVRPNKKTNIPLDGFLDSANH